MEWWVYKKYDTSLPALITHWKLKLSKRSIRHGCLIQIASLQQVIHSTLASLMSLEMMFPAIEQNRGINIGTCTWCTGTFLGSFWIKNFMYILSQHRLMQAYPNSLWTSNELSSELSWATTFVADFWWFLGILTRSLSKLATPWPDKLFDSKSSRSQEQRITQWRARSLATLVAWGISTAGNAMSAAPTWTRRPTMDIVVCLWWYLFSLKMRQHRDSVCLYI